ncbi:hypothetical protein G7067_07280 [Leucobacter insecticola]|uniref:Cupin n=1 Tax=Leucobacter insecticola TaxID=2714934 RepID=A0A6G8FIJ4_9MICO|nr:hypothetical protein [Leucobacter insecticola]QIM16270.1 hypothetical protein G7067_07280 [Leucobacter insecticola]
MPDTYEHLFVRNMVPCGSDFSNEGDAAGLPTPPNVSPPLGLMRVNEVPQSQIHMSHTWIHEVDEAHHWVNDHVHEYDEVLIWTGSDPENPEDLGAEIYLDIEGVRHNITTSGSVYIPAGVRHCPLGFIKVTRPFNFSALSLSPEYDSDENEGLIEKLKAEALATSESAS